MATHKLGYITASTFSPIIAGKKNELLVGAKTFAHQIALERLCLQGYIDKSYLDFEFDGNLYTDWGNKNELEAISMFEKTYSCKIKNKQKVYEHQNYPYLSCTVDGEIGNNQLIEVKCPAKAGNHFKNILYNSWIKDYYDQIQFQLFCSNKKLSKLISFDPRYIEKKRLHFVEIQPDLDWQINFLNKYKLFQTEVQNIINNFMIEL